MKIYAWVFFIIACIGLAIFRKIFIREGFSEKCFGIIGLVVGITLISCGIGTVIIHIQQRHEELAPTFSIIYIREIGTALEQYRSEHTIYPQHTGTWNNTLVDSISYHKPLNERDRWGEPFHYIADGDGYTLISYGKDRTQGGQGFEADIIFINGQFVAPSSLFSR